MLEATVVAPSARLALGFTDADLAVLERLRATAFEQQDWNWAQIVHASFADYLAAWDRAAGNAAPPTLTIIRFKRTGTYALTVDSIVVGTASTLAKILPAIRRVLANREN
jgi:hypothetical protein